MKMTAWLASEFDRGDNNVHQERGRKFGDTEAEAHLCFSGICTGAGTNCVEFYLSSQLCIFFPPHYHESIAKTDDLHIKLHSTQISRGLPWPWPRHRVADLQALGDAHHSSLVRSTIAQVQIPSPWHHHARGIY